MSITTETIDTVTGSSATGVTPTTHITLTENDLKKIADTFGIKLKTMITAIVDGVLGGLTSTVTNLETKVKDIQKENTELLTRVKAL